MNRGHPGRRVKNFLIDRHYQLRYAVQMVIVSTGLTAAPARTVVDGLAEYLPARPA